MTRIFSLCFSLYFFWGMEGGGVEGGGYSHDCPVFIVLFICCLKANDFFLIEIKLCNLLVVTEFTRVCHDI